jgi:hypothetical protein
MRGKLHCVLKCFQNDSKTKHDLKLMARQFSVLQLNELIMSCFVLFFFSVLTTLRTCNLFSVSCIVLHVSWKSAEYVVETIACFK